MQRLIFIYHLGEWGGGLRGGEPSGSNAAGSGDIKRRRSIKLTRANPTPGTLSKKIKKTTHKQNDSSGNVNLPASKTWRRHPEWRGGWWGGLPLTYTGKKLQVNPNDSMQESSEFLSPGWAAITASKQPVRGLWWLLWPRRKEKLQREGNVQGCVCVKKKKKKKTLRTDWTPLRCFFPHEKG